jgi:predicted metalloprotease with PDZ domain
MPREDAATAELRRLVRAVREQAYAAMAAQGGLTRGQAARFVANSLRLTDAYEAKMARGSSRGPLGLSLAEVQAILGSAYADQTALANLLIDQGQVVPFTRPVLGVGYGITPEGVAVVAVTPDGPAERAGLVAGDVIALINGEPAGQNTLARDKTSPASVVYTLTSGEVITVTPGGYVP